MGGQADEAIGVTVERLLQAIDELAPDALAELASTSGDEREALHSLTELVFELYGILVGEDEPDDHAIN
jgi:hypothetical protein